MTAQRRDCWGEQVKVVEFSGDSFYAAFDAFTRYLKHEADESVMVYHVSTTYNDEGVYGEELPYILYAFVSP